MYGMDVVNPDLRPLPGSSGRVEAGAFAPPASDMAIPYPGATQYVPEAVVIPVPGLLDQIEASAHARSVANLDAIAIDRSARHPLDGRGVVRRILPRTMLENSRPELRGKLAPPAPGPLPPGVEVRTTDSGARVVTINIHGGVPANKPNRRPADEDIAQLRDVARYVNSIDADVVLVQEVVNHPLMTWPNRVAEQASVLAHLIGADDMAFTPAFESFDGTREGTAIYTRNGFDLSHAVNIRLPDGVATQERGAGIAKVVAPDGTAFTVVNTHLAHLADNALARSRQLATISKALVDMRDGGDFTYTERLGGKRATAKEFVADRIVLGGDLNASQSNRDDAKNSPDEILHDAGLVHVNTLLRTSPDPDVRAKLPDANRPTAGDRRIDHLYSSGFAAHDATVAKVPSHHLPKKVPVTDHNGVIADLVPRTD